MTAMKPVVIIAAAVRGEAPYLLEWIAYHRALGIEAFLLADNGGDDGTSELLQELERRQVIGRIDWTGKKYFQLAFLQQAIEFGRLLDSGLFLIDVDEFLRPLDSTVNIADLARFWMADPEIGAVAINWAVYGSSGHRNTGEGLVIERFTRRAPQDFHINRHVKTFIRPDRCAGVSNNPHSVRLNAGRYIDSAGQDVTWDQTVVPSGISTKVVWRNIRVDHFVTKSLEEFERKRARGSAHSPSTEDERRHEDYFRYHDRNDVEDPMPEPLVRRTKIELERLRAKLGRLILIRPDVSSERRRPLG